MKNNKAILVLQDGTIFRGKGFGACKTNLGEVVFNTSLVGYEESLTDPSYAGQILTFTYPLFGNYGVRDGKLESDKIHVKGVVIKEYCDYPNHRLNEKDLNLFLSEFDVPGIYDIDARMLTKKIREHGVINGAIAVGDFDEEEVLRKVMSASDYSSQNFLEEVSVSEPVYHDAKGETTICMIDTGVKYSIIKNFLKRGINIWQMPYNSTPQDVRSKNPKGIFLANGPGDPTQARDAIKIIQELHKEYPICGICLGNQIIALGLGASTYKLKFGHRGTNQPVKDLARNKVYITSQNHGYAIDEKSLDGTGLEVSHINLNDGSVEGVKHSIYKIRSVQMHPEANPGPWDIEEIFDDFIGDLR